MAAGLFGATTTSGLSVGYDTARTDLTPEAIGGGAVLSVGTVGTGIKYILTSIQSANIGGVTASQTTEVQLSVSNVQQNDIVFANPWSQWSGVAEGVVVTASAPSAGAVYLNFSNTSATNIAVPTVNWNILVIGY